MDDSQKKGEIGTNQTCPPGRSRKELKEKGKKKFNQKTEGATLRKVDGKRFSGEYKLKGRGTRHGRSSKTVTRMKFTIQKTGRGEAEEGPQVEAGH